MADAEFKQTYSSLIENQTYAPAASVCLRSEFHSHVIYIVDILLKTLLDMNDDKNPERIHRAIQGLIDKTGESLGSDVLKQMLQHSNLRVCIGKVVSQ